MSVPATVIHGIVVPPIWRAKQSIWSDVGTVWGLGHSLSRLGDLDVSFQGAGGSPPWQCFQPAIFGQGNVDC